MKVTRDQLSRAAVATQAEAVRRNERASYSPYSVGINIEAGNGKNGLRGYYVDGHEDILDSFALQLAIVVADGRKADGDDFLTVAENMLAVRAEVLEQAIRFARGDFQYWVELF